MDVHEGLVCGALHRPAGEAVVGLVLTHGAGGNCGTALLVNAAEAFAARGWMVLRCDLPFRQQRPSGPPMPAMAPRDREGLRAAAGYLRTQGVARVFLGGHSYGGRQATMLAAEDPNICDALLLFSYPLHPPRKPHQLRTAHFPGLRTPAMFVSGTKDEFGTEPELREAIASIPARTLLRTEAGAGHDLRRGKLDFAAIAGEFLEFAHADPTA